MGEAGGGEGVAGYFVARMEPTGRREAPPDDKLRAIRECGVRSAPDFASLHPGYGLQADPAHG